MEQNAAAGEIRIGVAGLGYMGALHVQYLLRNEVNGAKLTAVCDSQIAALAIAGELDDRVARFDSFEAMAASGLIDAVFICTPHYFHPEQAIFAFEQGLHVMIEKPAGVYTKHVREMNEAARKAGTVFGIMYNQRSLPVYNKLKELADSGELGAIRRTNWIITDWYRPQSYYDSGSWRATWAGEGGGLLINQNPHQLDLWQWTIGMMPRRIRAFCHFGKRRRIEVEDDVTAYVEYDNGATGVFVTSTSDAPGTNRFEVTGDRGKVVIEENRMTFWQLSMPEEQFNLTFKGKFGQPEHRKIEIPVDCSLDFNIGQHKAITQNWVNAIVTGEALIAPGAEGINGLTLSNAMLLSTWIDDWVQLPIDEDLFYRKLQEKIRASEHRG